MTDAIKVLESNGYIVKSFENRFGGVLNEKCPIVYEILRPDHSNVYGANGVALEKLDRWADFLPTIVSKGEPEIPPYDKEAEDIRKAKEREYDKLYNEGAEGYNPYRA